MKFLEVKWSGAQDVSFKVKHSLLCFTQPTTDIRTQKRRDVWNLKTTYTTFVYFTLTYIQITCKFALSAQKKALKTSPGFSAICFSPWTL